MALKPRGRAGENGNDRKARFITKRRQHGGQGNLFCRRVFEKICHTQSIAIGRRDLNVQCLLNFMLDFLAETALSSTIIEQ
jgi:hypothetical protein